MSLLLLFPDSTSGGGGVTLIYPSPILLIKKGNLAIHTSANVYLEI